MATKSRDQWSAAYRRRIERAEALGKSRQQARGHRAQEHVIRRERERQREIATGELTTAEKQRIKRFADRQKLDYDELKDWAESHGFAKMDHLIKLQAEMHRQYKSASRRGTYSSLGRGFLDKYASDLDIDDISWLYYH